MAAAATQQFCLKWNNYHVNIASSFDSLRVAEDFVDVTLACNGCQLKAHRMVLSACSPFFRQLLKSNPHPHPIIILRDVSRYNMERLLDFMYHGEVNVAQEQLPEFLKVAELLKVKGLADEKREEAAHAGPNGQSSGVQTPSCSPAPVPAVPVIQQTVPPADQSSPPPAKRHRPMPLPALLQQPHPPAPPAAAPTAPPPPQPAGMGYAEPAAVKQEPPAESEVLAGLGTPEPPRPGAGGDEERVRVIHQQTGLSAAEDAALLVSAEVALEEAEQPPPPPEASRGQPTGPGPSAVPHEASTDPLSGGPGLLSAAAAASHPHPVLQRCPHCPAVFSSKSTIKDHVARVHFPVPVQCRLCGKLCANQGVLRVHRSRVHRQRATAATHGPDGAPRGTTHGPDGAPRGTTHGPRQPLGRAARTGETRRGEGNA